MSRELHIAICGQSRLLREALAARLRDEIDCGTCQVVDSADDLGDACFTQPINTVFMLGEELRENAEKALSEPCLAGAVMVWLGGKILPASTIFDAACAGRLAVLESDAPYAVALTTARRLLRGEGTGSPQLLAMIAEQIQLSNRERPSDEECQACALTDREAEIAELIAGGLINKQIARRLGIRVTTVKSHVNNLLRKLQVRRRGDVRRVGWGHMSRSGASHGARTCVRR